MANKTLIIDNRMRDIEKQKLKEMGYELIELSAIKDVYEEISSHVDIFACKVGKQIIIEPTQYESISKHNTKLICGAEKLKANYPEDIKYNVCIIGKKAIHSLDYTDSILKQQLINQGYELINTSQGYTNCSIAVIDDNSAIVTDKGLYKILTFHGIDTLYISKKLDIKLLKENNYSNKRGFIGGCISKIGNKIIVFGDLNKIDENEEIRKFINKKQKEIIEFRNQDVIDYGGLIEIQ